MFHMNHHRKEMKQTMERSKMFSQGYQEGLTRKDQEMMQQDYENQKAQDDIENKKKST
jgi:ribosome modulation factor